MLPKYLLLIFQLLPHLLVYSHEATSDQLLYSQRYSDKVLDQRLCVSMMTGLDFLSYSLSTIMWQYVDFYNHPLSYSYQRKNSQRYKEVAENKIEHDIILIRPDETHRGPINIEGDSDNFDLVL